MSLSGESYDAVVIGAGPAGSVCAARLAESGHRTLLIEAGHAGGCSRGRHGLVPPDLDSSWFWPPIEEEATGAVDHSSGRNAGAVSNYWVGRGMGGGSAINGMVLSTGSIADYDRWVDRHGCAGWTGEDMAPWIAKAVAALKPETPERSTGDDPTGNRVLAAFEAAASAFGWEMIEGATTIDPQAVGVLVPALSTSGGLRRSVATAYLETPPSNLVIQNNATVDRVMLSDGAATGVVLDDKRMVRAPLVVAAAGAIGSPRVLHRSGVRVGVGTRAKNHPSSVVTFEWPQPKTGGSLRRAPRVHRVLRLRVPLVGFGTTRDVSRLVEIHLIGPFTGDGVSSGILLAILGDPTSEGSLVDPGSDRPRLRTNRLRTADDRSALRSALRLLNPLATELTATLNVAAAIGGGTSPIELANLARLDDVTLDTWLVSNPGPTYHTVGTCGMGENTADRSCTESNPERPGVVRGFEGLVVADTSIFPDLVTGGLQLPATAVAERVVAGIVSRSGL